MSDAPFQRPRLVLVSAAMIGVGRAGLWCLAATAGLQAACLGPPKPAAALATYTEQDKERCESFRTSHNAWAGVAAAGGVVAGAGGLATIPLESDAGKGGVAAATIAVGALAATGAILASNYADDYAKFRCEEVLMPRPVQ